MHSLTTAPAPCFNVERLSIQTNGKSPRVLAENLSFAMHAGERWVVLGANGCGKSSVLSACAGLSTAGRSVSFDILRYAQHGFQSNQATPAMLAPLRSVCPQRLDWNTALTPLQLAHLLALDRSTNDSALSFPHEWLSQPVLMRSGGEQQRIAIALTVQQAASVCFLDEPLTHLDEVQQMQVLTSLKQHAHATGKAMMMVSHHIRLSLAWASHVLLPAGQGRWLAGTVADIATPQNIAQAYGIDTTQAHVLLA